MKIAVCPGSYDPVTYGHLDIIKRSLKIFDRVYVAVLVNSDKKTLFTPSERLEMLRACLKHIPGAVVESYDGMLTDYAGLRGASAIVKGLRSSLDYGYENEMALVNREREPLIETLFMPSDRRYSFLSSRMVREFLKYRQDISPYVPAEALETIYNAVKDKQKGESNG